MPDAPRPAHQVADEQISLYEASTSEQLRMLDTAGEGVTFSRDAHGHVEQPERLYAPYVVRAGDEDFEAQFSRFRCETGRVDAFRGDLGPDAVAALERSIGPTLRAYGYRTEAQPTELRGAHRRSVATP